jgi:N-methylhydantoinase A
MYPDAAPVSPDRCSIGVDIGGTFTDCVIVSAKGALTHGKAFTRPEDRARSVFEAVEAAAQSWNLTAEAVLSGASRLVHGTTTGTNVIVSRAGARVGLVTTAGHADSAFIMNAAGRYAGVPPERIIGSWVEEQPVPFVERSLVREVDERIDAHGDIVVPLDVEAVRHAVKDLVARGAESIAISFLWSTRNASHETAALRVAQSVDSQLFVSVGSALSARAGEFERTSVALVNAYVGPVMRRYLDGFESSLRRIGVEQPPLYVQCSGGAITPPEAWLAPIRTVHSGPVAGVAAAAFLGTAIGRHDVLVADMGGTSLDVCVIRDGVPLERVTSIIEGQELSLPMIDIQSIGAGGGSVAWLDETGGLNVGPMSVGADPGPACYGRGGVEATVTDADVVLGFIDPDSFFGGTVQLDRTAAESVIRRLAQEVGLSVVETAAGISRVTDANIADLIKRAMFAAGLDPRSVSCVAYGGGGPVHASSFAPDGGLSEVIVPLMDVAPTFSAFGASLADVSHFYEEAVDIELPHMVSAIVAPMRELGERVVKTLLFEGFDADEISVQRFLRVKHRAQIYDIVVPLSAGVWDRLDGKEVAREFSRLYESRFGEGSGNEASGIQITGLVVKGIGKSDEPFTLHEAARVPADQLVVEPRDVYWHELGRFTKTPVSRLATMVPDGVIHGPHLLQLPNTVIVVRPGQSCEFDPFGNAVLTVRN